MYSQQMQVVANSETKAQTVLHSSAPKVGGAKAFTAGVQVSIGHIVFFGVVYRCGAYHTLFRTSAAVP